MERPKSLKLFCGWILPDEPIASNLTTKMFDIDYGPDITHTSAYCGTSGNAMMTLRKASLELWEAQHRKCSEM